MRELNSQRLRAAELRIGTHIVCSFHRFTLGAWITDRATPITDIPAPIVAEMESASLAGGTLYQFD